MAEPTTIARPYAEAAFKLADAQGKLAEWSAALANLAAGEMDVVRTGDARKTVGEIHEELLEAFADESRHLLEERVVGSAAEIDACLILGAGFPFFRGGITRYLDQAGVSQRVVGRPLAELGASAG